jgi:hypothetical protein
MSKESWVMAQMPWANKWGVLGSCRQGELVLILGPARAEREDRVRGKEHQTRCFLQACVIEKAWAFELAERGGVRMAMACTTAAMTMAWHLHEYTFARGSYFIN